MQLKGIHFAYGAEIQEAVTDDLMKVEKRNFRQLFRNCMTTQKPVYMPMELILNLKKRVCFPRVSSIFLKKITPKTFRPHCVYSLKYEVGVACNDSMLWGFVLIRLFSPTKVENWNT